MIPTNLLNALTQSSFGLKISFDFQLSSEEQVTSDSHTVLHIRLDTQILSIFCEHLPSYVKHVVTAGQSVDIGGPGIHRFSPFLWPRVP